MTGPNKGIHPDEAVVYSTAVQSATLRDETRDILDTTTLHLTTDMTREKSNRITIAKDQGRLLKEGAEWLVPETERRNEAAAALMSLKNGLGSYTYNLRNLKTNEKLRNGLNGVVNGTNHELDAKYVCDVHSPSLHIDKCHKKAR
jgi:hypothetical protein